MIDKYLESSVFQNWTVEEITMLKKQAYKASCPAFLYSCADILPENDIARNISLLTTRADKYESIWSEFEMTDFNT